MREKGSFIIEFASEIPYTSFEVVLGRNKYFTTYVTWIYGKENDSYFWGHYFNDKESAIKDYHERIKHEIESSIEWGII